MSCCCWLGCSASNDAAPANGTVSGTAGSFGTGGSSAVDPNGPRSLEFEMTSELAARQQVTLKVRALPARKYAVRFVLPPTGGDPLDAALDRSLGDTDENGVASVVLTAPSSPTTFEVRANVGERSATLSLTVADRGLATLQVDPDYPSSLRDITTWVATAHLEKSCADVPGIPPPDGELKAPLAAKDAAPVLGRVPAGTRLAVTLRSGHFAGGCTSIEMLPPGPTEPPQIVKVTVLNRPIDLSVSGLAFSLDLTPPAQTWNTTLTLAGAEMLTGMLGSSRDDAEALLDAMRGQTPSSAQAFEDARNEESWDAVLRSRWGQGAATKLRDTVNPWLGAGRQLFFAAEHPLAGDLTPLSQPKGIEAQSTVLLTMRTVAGLAAANAGFIDGAQASWRASADDTVVLSTDVYFVRSKLAAALGEAAALGQAAAAGRSSESGPAALADALDCGAISSALAGAGDDATLAYAGCDEECLAETCRSAVEALWARGADASGVDYSRLNVTATGVANVGDAAEVVGLAGSWIGELSDATGTLPTGGAITAAASISDR